MALKMDLRAMRSEALHLLSTLPSGGQAKACMEYVNALQMALLGAIPSGKMREKLAWIVETCGKRPREGGGEDPRTRKKRKFETVRTYDKFNGEGMPYWKSYSISMSMRTCQTKYNDMYQTMVKISGIPFINAMKDVKDWSSMKRHRLEVVATLRGRDWPPCAETKSFYYSRRNAKEDIGFHMRYDETLPLHVTVCAYAVLCINEETRVVELYWEDTDANVERWWGARELLDRTIYKICSDYVTKGMSGRGKDEYTVVSYPMLSSERALMEWGFERMDESEKMKIDKYKDFPRSTETGGGEEYHHNFHVLSLGSPPDSYRTKVELMRRKSTKAFQYYHIESVLHVPRPRPNLKYHIPEWTFRTFVRDPNEERMRIDESAMSDTLSIYSMAFQLLQTRNTKEIMGSISKSDVVVVLYVKLEKIMRQRRHILENDPNRKMDEEIEYLHRIALRVRALCKKLEIDSGDVSMLKMIEKCLRRFEELMSARRALETVAIMGRMRKLFSEDPPMDEVLRLEMIARDLSLSGSNDDYEECLNVMYVESYNRTIQGQVSLWRDILDQVTLMEKTICRIKQLEVSNRDAENQYRNAIRAISDGASAAVAFVSMKMVGADYVYVPYLAVDTWLSLFEISYTGKYVMLNIARQVPTERGVRGVLLYSTVPSTGFYERIGMRRKKTKDFGPAVSKFLKKNECVDPTTGETLPIYEFPPLNSPEKRSHGIASWSEKIKDAAVKDRLEKLMKKN